MATKPSYPRVTDVYVGAEPETRTDKLRGGYNDDERQGERPDPAVQAMQIVLRELGVRLIPLPNLWTEAHDQTGRVIARWRTVDQLIAQFVNGDEVIDDMTVQNEPVRVTADDEPMEPVAVAVVHEPVRVQPGELSGRGVVWDGANRTWKVLWHGRSVGSFRANEQDLACAMRDDLDRGEPLQIVYERYRARKAERRGKAVRVGRKPKFLVQADMDALIELLRAARRADERTHAEAVQAWQAFIGALIAASPAFRDAVHGQGG